MSIIDNIKALFSVATVPDGFPSGSKLSRPDNRRLRRQVVELQRTTDALTRRDIGDWRQAWQLAINVERPDRRALYDIYRDVEIDLHLSGCVKQREGFVLSRSFKIMDDSGSENKDALRFFDAPWFKQLMKYALESVYWGHSLIELGNVVTVPGGPHGDNPLLTYDGVTLINRKHVIPELHRVLQNLGDDYHNGIDYHEPPFASWLIEVGQPDDLGLYLRAATQTIPKKNALAFWDTFAEIFGMPMRIAHTTMRDEKELKKMEKMMADMGTEGWGLFQEGTDIEVVESSKGDAFNVYDRRIDRANSELSKLVIGQTMTIEDGSSLSQSETHLKVFENLVEADSDMIRDVVNNQLLPRMVAHGFPLSGLRFDWDYSVDYTPEQQQAYEQMVLNNYEVDPNYFEEKYGMPVTRQRYAPALAAPVPPAAAPALAAPALAAPVPPAPLATPAPLTAPVPPAPLAPLAPLAAEATVPGASASGSAAPAALAAPAADRLRALFGALMRRLHATQRGAALNISILAEPEAQAFIEAHAATLDSSFAQVPMSDTMRSRLQRSDYVFSGIKTFRELGQAFPSLIDENGNRKPFERFLNDVQTIDATYNQHYLRTEYNHAQASAEMAARWERFQQDGDRYNLQYRTAGDDKVRPEHAALDRVTLPIDDPFWDSYYPPNGWNCRCTVVQVRKSKFPTTPHDEAMSLGEQATGTDTRGIFHYNPGKEQKTFPDHNPYTISRCRTCPVAKGATLPAGSPAGTTLAFLPTDSLCQACHLIRQTHPANRAEYYRLLNNPDYKDVQYDEKTGSLYAEHKNHSNHDNGKRYFGNMSGIDLEKEFANVAFHRGHSVIMRQEGTAKEVVNGVLLLNRELDTILDGRLAEIASVTNDRKSYEYKLLHKNQQLRVFNGQHGTNADTVILYFHDETMYSEKRIRDSIEKLQQLHKPIRDENGKPIKDENGNQVFSEELYDIVIKHVLCVSKTGIWEEYHL